MPKDMNCKGEKFLTLSIESSCDETAAAVLANGRELLSNVISTQIETHKLYGGVVPEIASRQHLMNINSVIAKALDDAGVEISDIDLIAVTYGPGLIGALVIGVAAAKALALANDIPLVGVNHMHGHISSNYLEYKELEPPFIGLVVSGGHTNIIKVNDYNECKILGATRDDAAGEAMDKVARVVGLGYPGGPKIDKAAREGDKRAIEFKRVYLEDGSYDFSFSGLKTQVLNYINNERQAGREINVPDLAASFQESIMEVIADKSIAAAVEYDSNKVVVAGGVAANSRLRELLEHKGAEKGIEILKPAQILCTDNDAMIACSAYYQMKKGEFADMSLDACPGLEF